jgi:hypothetical protein
LNLRFVPAVFLCDFVFCICSVCSDQIRVIPTPRLIVFSQVGHHVH